MQTFWRLGVEPTIVRTRWIFGFQRRRVFTCEWETLLPKLGPLLQISHVDATAVLLLDLVMSAESFADRAKGYREGVAVRQSTNYKGWRSA